jgi:predicted nucleic acid-binding Zn ribbon protein
MPIYEYEYLDKKGEGTGKTVELVQAMAEDAYTKHPESGEPIRRVISVPRIAGKWSDMKAKGQLSNENLDRLGFTKYEKKGDGYMERVAGKEGPKSISLDD